MPGVSKEQIEQARSIDLLSYLERYEPGIVKRAGGNEYHHAGYHRFIISNGKWNWIYGDVGGVGALDYLVKVHGKGFVEAVEMLCGERATPVSTAARASPSKKDKQKKPFLLPKPNTNNDRAVAYLRGRGIDLDTIKNCIQRGYIYESKDYHNAVFVGHDDNGTARFAAVRGTNSDFRMDVESSDKRYNFHLPPLSPENDRNLICFESPIDAISHISIQKMTGFEVDGHRLSLGCTAPRSLISFLDLHPEIERCRLCLDNDEAGHKAMRRIMAQLSGDSHFRHIAITISPPALGKDYNEMVQQIHKLEKEAQPQGRREAAITI